MRKIKVIHFIDRIGRGGTQAVLYDWARNIDRDKFQFDFLVFMDGQTEYINKFKELGCNIYQISTLNVRHLPRFMLELSSFFEKHRYDIAHGHSKSKNFFFLFAAKKYGIKVRISHSHNTQFQRMAYIGEILKPMLKLVATDYFACSDIAGIWLFGKKAYDQGKITIIKNGVNTQEFKFDPAIREEYRKKLKLENSIIYGHIGKYMEQKNHMFLLDIFNQIHKKQPNAKLLLIGGGYDDIIEAVNNKINFLKLEDSVIQLGLRSDVARLLQAMDVFLLPSLYEGLPVVGVEAQAAGLPCLISNSVTKEVGLLSTTVYLSLSQPASVWAQKAIELYLVKKDRSEASQSIHNQGYDSRLVADKLMKIYAEKVNI